MKHAHNGPGKPETSEAKKAPMEEGIASGNRRDRHGVNWWVSRLMDGDEGQGIEAVRRLKEIGDPWALPYLSRKAHDGGALGIAAGEAVDSFCRVKGRWMLRQLVDALDANYMPLNAEYPTLPDLITSLCTASDVGWLLGQLNDVNERHIGRIILDISDESAAPALRGALDSGDYQVKFYTLPAIGKIKDRESVPVLISLLERPILETQYLERLGASAESRDPVLEEGHRGLAARQSGNFGDADVPELIRMCDHTLRCRVIQTLGEIGDPRATLPLMAVLEDDMDTIRNRAVQALGGIGDYEKLLPAMVSSGRRTMISLGKSLEAFVDGCDCLEKMQEFFVQWDRIMAENRVQIPADVSGDELDVNLARVYSCAESKEKKLRSG